MLSSVVSSSATTHIANLFILSSVAPICSITCSPTGAAWMSILSVPISIFSHFGICFSLICCFIFSIDLFEYCFILNRIRGVKIVA